MPGGEPCRVDLDLELAVLLTEDRDIGDAGHAGEARLDDPAGQVGQFQGIKLGRVQADQQGPARR